MKDWPPIYFYVPSTMFDAWPGNENEYMSWAEGEKHLGVAAWIVLTYLRLKAHGYPVERCSELPRRGIVITHTRVLRDGSLRPRPDVLLVCAEGDRGRCINADIHVVQNPLQERQSWFWKRRYIPHWTQPGLMPRDPQRGDKVETVGYLGTEFNLDPELRSDVWLAGLKRLNLRWETRFPSQAWTRYDDLDCVVTIRGFHKHWNDIWKPASKLFNAWRADVIPLVSADSAMEWHGVAGEDYLRVDSLQHLLATLEQLKIDPSLCQKLRHNMARRRAEISGDVQLGNWVHLIDSLLVPAYFRKRRQGATMRVPAAAWRVLTYGLDWADRWRRYYGGRISAKLRAEEFRGYV